jgi:GWxTD domain-containing protein
MRPVPKSILSGILPFVLFPVFSGRAVTIRADHNAFLINEKQSRVEITYQITAPRMFPSKPAVWDLKMNLTILKADSPWMARSWDQKVPIDASGPSAASPLKYIGKIAFDADTGAYRTVLSVTDRTHGNETDSCTIQLLVESFKAVRPLIGDIVLASSIKTAESPEDGKSPFLKSGLVVIPKPDLTFLKGEASLFYYVELYNLKPAAAARDYLFQSVVTRMDGAIVIRSGIQRYTDAVLQNDIASYEEIQIAALDSGSYQLQVALYDTARKELAHQSKTFAIHVQPAAIPVAVHPVDSQKNPFASLSDEALDEEIQSLKPILKKEELDILKGMNDNEARRRFLNNYWISRDEKRLNPENALYVRHKQRVLSANLNFQEFQKKGWKTDRGRIFILYGAPDDVERFPSTNDRVPHEIWKYNNIESGVEFIFAEIGSDRTYTLVHSTKDGEVSNPDYLNLIERSY